MPSTRENINLPAREDFSLGGANDSLRDAFYKYVEKNIDDPTYRSATTMNRTSIPYDLLSPSRLRSLGFEPSYVAVPELGQKSFRTWRHPLNETHIHEHTNAWTMHQDTAPSWQMLAKRWRLEHPDASYKDYLKYYWGDAARKSIPHAIKEGAPGYVNFISNLILGRQGFSGKDMSNMSSLVRAGSGIGLASLLLAMYRRGKTRQKLRTELVPSTAGVLGFLAGDAVAKGLQEDMSDRSSMAKSTWSGAALRTLAPFLTAYMSYKAAKGLQQALPLRAMQAYNYIYS